jgi:hypothetical protein
MRYFSYLFHFILALFCIAVSGLALGSGMPTLQFGMLPWTGRTLVYVLFFGALAGLLTVLLAMRGRLRVLFFLWSAVVFALLAKGYIFSGYKFHTGEFQRAMYLLAGSFVAFAGGWFQLRTAPRPRKY